MSDQSDFHVPVDDRYQLGIVNTERPSIPEGLVEGSRFSSFNRALDYSAEDFIDSNFCEDDWSNFAAFLENNSFELEEWDFTVRKDECLYSLEVSPVIDYSTDTMLSRFFRPRLEVNMIESIHVNGVEYEPAVYLDIDDPMGNHLGLPEPVFHRIAGELCNYTNDVLTEGLEEEVY